ncbi:N-(5'-phosphoribosyl)anthranilate isomerase, partial [Pseudomonas aeruginosa]|nr:N-(5'-phosphoribosyl)anthranilate isomerase [Pseudomonas aeruginosa]
MPAVRIKICGITRVEDALAAPAAGAAGLGRVLFWESPRGGDFPRAGGIVG